ncbi:hypothetical protein G4228_010168 [Cervus hanglu yarkandensis]|nr:hypothetical protein G4228_010168 [Cervus hanglu yarkandensis]
MLLAALVLPLPIFSVRCIDPPVLESMKLKGVIKRHYYPGDRIDYECYRGYFYVLPYLLSATCEPNGSWSRIEEACLRKSCPDIKVKHGKVVAPNETFEWESEAHISCDEGYFLRGKPIIVCNLIGENVSWSDTIPHCEKIYCGQPPKIKHGKHTNSYRNIFEYNELITYSCDLSNGPDEYSLVGQSKLVCIEPNKWSSDPPLCKEACGDPPRFDTMRLQGAPKPNYRPGECVQYECRLGFKPKVPTLPRSALCQDNNTWSSLQDACIEKSCPNVGEPVNGQVNFVNGSALFGSQVHFACNPGFYLIGAKILYCAISGDNVAWSDNIPICENACGDPPRFETMRLQGAPKPRYRPGERIQYDCRLGFKPIIPLRSRSAVCEDDNTWSALEEACTRKSCPNLGDPMNGQVYFVNGSILFGSQAHFVCNQGFYLIGERILHCEISENNVSWNDDSPMCERILCSTPGNIKNGRFTIYKDEYQYNEIVTYVCDPSNGPDEYSLVGESRLVCVDHDRWSSDPPECKVVKCDYPVVEHGMIVSGFRRKFYYKTQVVFKCNQGFSLHGSSTIVCNANSTWEPTIPTCTQGMKVSFSFFFFRFIF